MTFLNGIWLQSWMLSPPYAAETSFAESVALCQSYGIAGILVKAFDGLSWHASYAPGADSLRSVEQAQTQQAFARERGVGYAVWTNPLHGPRAFLAMQADLYAQLGAAIGMMAIDSEPYQSFWGANRPVGDAAFFMDRFRAGAPNCATIWQPDPRPARLAELRPAEWAQHMNVHAPQIYAADFNDGTSASDWIDIALQQAEQFGIAECAPTLGATDSAASLGAAAQRAIEQNMRGLLLWRLGTANADQLQTLGSTMPPGGPGRPPSEVQDIVQALRGLADRLEALKISA